MMPQLFMTIWLHAIRINQLFKNMTAVVLSIMLETIAHLKSKWKSELLLNMRPGLLCYNIQEPITFQYAEHEILVPQG